MIVYMIRNKETRQYWHRGYNKTPGYWTEQQQASVWTDKRGVAAALSSINRRDFAAGRAVTGEIVPFTLTPAQEKSKSIILVYCDGWSGIYNNGILIKQNHRLTPKEVLQAADVECEIRYANQQWLEEVGVLPRELEKCKLRT